MKSFSTIISEDHTAEISTWINHNTTTYTSNNNPYRFELILRGSQDGFAPQKFWDICHGHVNIVVIAKVKATDEIIGGYNPLAWDNSNTIESKCIKTNDDDCYYRHYSYEKPIRTSSSNFFSISNYEVFKIVRKFEE
ncbi:hypothetical protein Glove_117g107 [Diversispora epigaea]|uniref:TLDc domain-containing protein n=1 Tax=Diversispora epigaea TaxID=1348612 RepID=A0A397J8R8_9GLOM|nr:hypothetical protein Glove_117g107 [Diversispora epigaea]